MTPNSLEREKNLGRNYSLGLGKGYMEMRTEGFSRSEKVA